MIPHYHFGRCMRHQPEKVGVLIAANCGGTTSQSVTIVMSQAAPPGGGSA
jgi:hypothetical protein